MAVVATTTIVAIPTQYVFLTPNELEEVLKNPAYWAKMTSEDLKRRGAGMSLPHWTIAQKNRVLATIAGLQLDFAGIQFGITNESCEGGLPHTHGNTIILSERVFKFSNEQFTRTLVHEYIHVWQRRSPEQFAILYKKWDFEPYNGTLPADLVAIVRNNPDVSGQWIWKNQYILLPTYIGNIGMSAAYVMYNTQTGTVDVDSSAVRTAFGPAATQPEHPAELAATILTELILDKLVPRTVYEEAAAEWLAAAGVGAAGSRKS